MLGSLPPLPDLFGNYAIAGIDEILTPEPISAVPQTLGWQLLLALLLLYLARRAQRRWQYWLRNRYRATALRQLAEIMQASADTGSRLAALAGLLKATALQAYPRREIAALNGEAWLQWLNRHTAEQSFNAGCEELLVTGQYQQQLSLSPTQLSEFASAVAQWIRHHREPPGHA